MNLRRRTTRPMHRYAFLPLLLLSVIGLASMMMAFLLDRLGVSGGSR